MAKSVRIELRTTPELAAAIDAARGDVPRNVWLERAAEAALPHQGTVQTQRPVRVRQRSVPGPSFNRATTLKR